MPGAGEGCWCIPVMWYRLDYHLLATLPRASGTEQGANRNCLLRCHSPRSLNPAIYVVMVLMVVRLGSSNGDGYYGDGGDDGNDGNVGGSDGSDRSEG